MTRGKEPGRTLHRPPPKCRTRDSLSCVMVIGPGRGLARPASGPQLPGVSFRPTWQAGDEAWSLESKGCGLRSDCAPAQTPVHPGGPSAWTSWPLVGSIPAGHVLATSTCPVSPHSVPACSRPRDRYTTRQPSLQAEKKNWPETLNNLLCSEIMWIYELLCNQWYWSCYI